MPTAASDLRIPVPGGAIPATIVRPATLPAPVLIVIPSIFGVIPAVRETLAGFAADGFIALAPDVYWRTIPGPKDHAVERERDEAYARNKSYDHAAGLRDLAALRDFALALPECNGKWGLVGYCFGGRYALLAGAQFGADAVAAFHPSNMGREPAAARTLTCPASFHFGGADQSVPMSEVEAVQAALAHNPAAETFVYPGVAHGFTGKGRPAYDEAVTRLSRERALRVLGPLRTV